MSYCRNLKEDVLNTFKLDFESSFITKLNRYPSITDFCSIYNYSIGEVKYRAKELGLLNKFGDSNYFNNHYSTYGVCFINLLDKFIKEFNRLPSLKDFMEYTGYKRKYIENWRTYLNIDDKFTYGHTDNSFERRKFTNLQKYGCEIANNSEIVKKKTELTNLSKYGTKNPASSELVKNKIKSTMLDRYNGHYFQTQEFQNKYKSIMLNRYGVINSGQIDSVKFKKLLKQSEANHKSYETKRRHNSFGNVSSNEDFIAKKLSLVFDSYKEDYTLNNKYRQYKSESYPYPCDFYIPEIDTYIEYNGYFTHGGRPFTGSKEDYELLEKWKNKYNEIINLDNYIRSNPGAQYKMAIYIFSKKDPEKRTLAKANNLNYLEFFNLKEFNEWFYSSFGEIINYEDKINK